MPLYLSFIWVVGNTEKFLKYRWNSELISISRKCTKIRHKWTNPLYTDWVFQLDVDFNFKFLRTKSFLFFSSHFPIRPRWNDTCCWKSIKISIFGNISLTMSLNVVIFGLYFDINIKNQHPQVLQLWQPNFIKTSEIYGAILVTVISIRLNKYVCE